MNDLNLLRQVSLIYEELIEEARGPACDPSTVRAFTEGQDLDPGHHTARLPGLPADAMQLRERLEQPRPVALLSFLLRTKKGEMMNEDGLTATFSDDSAARLRLEPAGPDSFRLVVEPPTVSLGAGLDGVSLEDRGNGRPLVKEEDGCYAVEVSHRIGGSRGPFSGPAG